jgi:hypothetical protein
LIEKSRSYRYIDEVISDDAAFQAMKVSKRLDRMNYFSNDSLQALS